MVLDLDGWFHYCGGVGKLWLFDEYSRRLPFSWRIFFLEASRIMTFSQARESGKDCCFPCKICKVQGSFSVWRKIESLFTISVVKLASGISFQGWFASQRRLSLLRCVGPRIRFRNVLFPRPCRVWTPPRRKQDTVFGSKF